MVCSRQCRRLRNDRKICSVALTFVNPFQHDDLLLADCGVIPSHPLCGVGLTMSRLLNPVKIQEILVYEGTSMREHQS